MKRVSFGLAALALLSFAVTADSAPSTTRAGAAGSGINTGNNAIGAGKTNGATAMCGAVAFTGGIVESGTSSNNVVGISAGGNTISWINFPAQAGPEPTSPATAGLVGSKVLDSQALTLPTHGAEKWRAVT